MAVDIRLVAVAFICISITPSFAQICSYMINIPRDPKPDDFPVVETEGVSWSERPLVPAPERPEVCMDIYETISNNLGIQIIYMEEEIEGDVLIAKFNYDGPKEPYIEPLFVSGSFSLLEPEVRKDDVDGDWYLVVTRRQDYESPGIQQYTFTVGVEDEPLSVLVTVIIVNIDDNPPIIHLFEACQVPEGGEPELTDCVYDVTDLDGEISTSVMKFTIDSDRDDDDIFAIDRSYIQGDWYTMHMTLRLKKTLDYEENALHVFTVTASDSLPNNHSVRMMVQVENVKSRPPRWVEIFAVQQFDEKTSQRFTVRAIDGDTGINDPIYYKLERAEEDTFFRIETIPGGRDGAIFYVDPINRDKLEKDLFQLNIVAHKYDDESFATRAPIAIIVNDVNDNAPEPLKDEYHAVMREETAMTLDIEEFGFHDIDLGPHAQYTVHLESVTPENAAEAFYISPEVGYQRQTFIIGTSNHRMLDYEDEDFQNIKLKVVATDMNRTDLVGEVFLYIKLENWNDELPIFNENTYYATFEETVGEGFQLETVPRAFDRDIGDRVKHSLMGNIDYLQINENTGEIFVTRNEAFDYHRQNEIIVQVRAEDTLGELLGEPSTTNTATTQLVIQLLDINNTPPTLRLPRGSPQVKENREHGEVVTDTITATDPDTTAHLVFEIDWESSYATKQGRDTDTDKFHRCVEIETIYPDETKRGSAIGKIVVTMEHDVIIDFEEFEVLYLAIIVRDINTVDGDDTDESTFTITIVDLNDNPPVWASGTLEQEFRVREMSASGVVIGSVLATDIDGPLYNQVRYTIFPRDDTPEDLVLIDFHTGQISVKTTGAIDADEPPRWNLYYTVIASDKCSTDDPADCPPDPHYFDTEGQITIHITDTNNKVPEPDYTKFDRIVEIYENATTGDDITDLFASDLDRDDIYNKVRYQINYLVNPLLLRFFAVDLDTGRLYVEYTTNEVLDRDGLEPQHQIFFNLIDNFYLDGDGNRNQAATDITVVLLDVNDNAPELPEPTPEFWTMSENLAADMTILPTLHAPDADEPNTPNSLVGFKIRDLEITNREIDVPDLFTIRSINTDTGELVSLMDLKGYWGTYAIHIDAFDHGDPQQFSDEVYELIIRPYNYHKPEFVFPRQDTVLRLAKESAMTNNILVTLDGSLPERVYATDEDGLEAGIVTFEIIGNEEALEYFEITNDGSNYGALLLRRPILDSHRDFEVTIRATDAGTEPGPESSDITFRIAFIPITGAPVFEVPTATVGFMEQEAGLLESHQLPTATDPKNYLCSDDCNVIYYSIVEGNSDGHFTVDALTNKISVVKELNRDENTVHTLLVAASNSPDAASTLTGSTLTVTVNVRETDPRPVFERELYTAGISVQDTINRVLLTVKAAHSEGAEITYTIDSSTMQVHETLETVIENMENPFLLNPETGVLTLNIQPMAFMHGMFQFQVVATDPAGGYDRADVNIYLISSLNRVTFRFVNTVQKIEESADFIAATFSRGFEMICNIDQVLLATDDSGAPLDNVTDVRAHFIRDDQPVLADEIEELRRDTTLLRDIQTTLNTELLVLSDFVTDISPDISTNSSQITIYVLAALAGALSLLLIVLVITFWIRTRMLNRRLEALSMTKYGSVDSGLNRIGITAPGTNKHAIEGSNPIWNETIKAPDFDAISDVSNDSSLVGIEDLPQFRNDYYPPNANSIDEILDNKIASHKNNFGFKPSYNQDFGNKFQKPFSEI